MDSTNNTEGASPGASVPDLLMTQNENSDGMCGAEDCERCFPEAKPINLSSALEKCDSLAADLRSAIESDNRSREIIFAIQDRLQPMPGEHIINAAARVAGERDDARERARKMAALLAYVLANCAIGDHTKKRIEKELLK